ncbi:MAG: amidohydrolase [Holophagales bacterium]|nr:amidohydrolase [Holophagales bacterium]
MRSRSGRHPLRPSHTGCAGVPAGCRRRRRKERAGRKAGIRFAFLALTIAAQPVVAQFQAGEPAPSRNDPADTILDGGNVYTPDGWAESIAIRDGVIVAVGDSASVAAFRTGSTDVIDLAGRTVFPGFHDVHVHPLIAGMQEFSCRLPPGATPDIISESVGECASKAEPGEWVSGGNWVAAVFEPGQQTRQFLDAVSPDNPVFLYDESHHSVWVNTMALEVAGIDRDTPDPAGGIIERDQDGDPTGLLRETANAMVASVIPPASDAQKMQGMKIATHEMLAHGITSFTVAYANSWQLGALAQLAREGTLKQRVRACVAWAHDPALADAAESQLAIRATYESERLKVDCVKIMLDGVPTESHTAAMLAPYEDSTGEDDPRPKLGLLLVPQEALNDAVTAFDRQGLHVKMHAAGDGAVRAAIDAVAAARERNGFGGPMHDVGHSTFVDPADIPRPRELGMAWEFSPYIWFPTPMAAIDIRKAVGDERMKRWVPIRDALETGALVAAGSDWPVVPLVDPWLAVETMVTRQVPGGSEETLGLQGQVRLEDALRIMTWNGARLMGQGDKVGTIEVGKEADLVVTSQNPFDVEPTEVQRTKVEMTFIAGERVYTAGAN